MVLVAWCWLNCLQFHVWSTAVFNKEDDIATYTIKAVDDPRTLNKILYVKPPANTISFNDLVSLWEKKIEKTLERIYVPEEQLLKNIQGKNIISLAFMQTALTLTEENLFSL